MAKPVRKREKDLTGGFNDEVFFAGIWATSGRNAFSVLLRKRYFKILSKTFEGIRGLLKNEDLLPRNVSKVYKKIIVYDEELVIFKKFVRRFYPMPSKTSRMSKTQSSLRQGKKKTTVGKPSRDNVVKSGDSMIKPIFPRKIITREKIVNPIKAEKDLVNLLKNIDDMNYLKTKLLKFDGTLVKIKLEGDNFESSLPGSLIMGLANYQEKIYRIYLVNKYGVGTRRKITPEEAKQLEIRVIIKRGCTEVWIELAYEFFKEALKIMPVDQIQPTILGLAGIIAGSAIVLGVGSTAVKEAFRAKRKSLALKKKQSKDEVEKKKIECIETTLNTAVESMRTVSQSIIQAGPSRVLINDKIVSMSKIVSAVEGLDVETPEVTEEQSAITGTYRIQRVTLDFKKESASADIFDVKTGDPINGLVLQPKSVYDGSYKVLKTAQDKQDIKMQIIVTMRDDRICKAVLDKILE